MELTKLAEVVDVLNDMRSKEIIGDYAVGGAVAAALHYQPISTVDLDIFFVFDPPQTGLILSLETVYNYFREKGFEFDKDFIYVAGWPVQFIESSHDPLWKEGLKQAQSVAVNGREIKVFPPEHLAAMWIQAGRGKDFRKIADFDEGGVMDAEVLRDVLRRFGLIEKWRNKQEERSDEYKY